jgi:hypothetical protein
VSRQKFEPSTSRIQVHGVAAMLTLLRIRTSASIWRHAERRTRNAVPLQTPSVPLSKSSNSPPQSFCGTCRFTRARTIQSTHSHSTGIVKIHFNNIPPPSTPRFSQRAPHFTFANGNTTRISCSVELILLDLTTLEVQLHHSQPHH